MGLASAIEAVSGVVREFVPDKDKANELTAQIEEALIRSRAAAIVAEAQGSWLQRNWRPITMTVFVYIVFNNYILVPYLAALGITVPTLEIPDALWTLITVGLGGYVLGRSGEKIAERWKAPK